jgi:hypothetical protein
MRVSLQVSDRASRWPGAAAQPQRTDRLSTLPRVGEGREGPLRPPRQRVCVASRPNFSTYLNQLSSIEHLRGAYPTGGKSYVCTYVRSGWVVSKDQVTLKPTSQIKSCRAFLKWRRSINRTFNLRDRLSASNRRGLPGRGPYAWSGGEAVLAGIVILKIKTYWHLQVRVGFINYRSCERVCRGPCKMPSNRFCKDVL